MNLPKDYLWKVVIHVLFIAILLFRLSRQFGEIHYRDNTLNFGRVDICFNVESEWLDMCGWPSMAWSDRDGLQLCPLVTKQAICASHLQYRCYM